MLPLIEVLADGHEWTKGELTEQVADRFDLTESERLEPIPSGPQSVFYNRVVWAKMHLKYAGPGTAPRSSNTAT
jgi:restriction system protein